MQLTNTLKGTLHHEKCTVCNLSRTNQYKFNPPGGSFHPGVIILDFHQRHFSIFQTDWRKKMLLTSKNTKKTKTTEGQLVTQERTCISKATLVIIIITSATTTKTTTTTIIIVLWKSSCCYCIRLLYSSSLLVFLFFLCTSLTKL